MTCKQKRVGKACRNATEKWSAPPPSLERKKHQEKHSANNRFGAMLNQPMQKSHSLALPTLSVNHILPVF